MWQYQVPAFNARSSGDVWQHQLPLPLPLPSPVLHPWSPSAYLSPFPFFPFMSAPVPGNYAPLSGLSAASGQAEPRTPMVAPIPIYPPPPGPLQPNNVHYTNSSESASQPRPEQHSAEERSSSPALKPPKENRKAKRERKAKEDVQVDGPLKKKKVRRARRVKEEGAPKKPATCFVYYSNLVREKIRAENPGISFTNMGRKLGKMWREMDVEEKKSYVDQANALKCRYAEQKAEQKAAKKRLGAQPDAEP